MKTPAANVARLKFEARVALAVSGTATPFYGQGTSDKIVQSHATEAVLDAAALALDDIGSGMPVSMTTKSALDRMWATQRADGAWDWLEFALEPWERGSDWGAAMAALVAGTIPPDTTTAQTLGTTKLIGYLRQRLADKTTTMALHDRAMLLWASGTLSGLLEPTQANAIADDLAKTQQTDGGFALSSWGRGNRVIDAETKKGDGYATSLAILALCRGAADGPKREDVRRGLAWLAQNQREDGSWVGRSVNVANAQNQVFMTDAATAYASVAIAACGPRSTP
jgi:squalene-hopene/tetraprenyl-beta-curcumene cyclase